MTYIESGKNKQSLLLWLIITLVMLLIGLFTWWDKMNTTYDGLYMVYACNAEDKCYTLQANVTNVGGEDGRPYLGLYVDTLFFNDGGHLNMACKLGDNGYCSVDSSPEAEWTVTLVKRISEKRLITDTIN